jgi:GNAT superfamily N-acetyltransferase
MIAIEVCDPASEEAADLIRALDAELWHRYPAGPIHGIDIATFKAAGGVFLVLREQGRAVACGAYRPIAAHTVEIKRMFTRSEARGKGYSRRILQALEAHAYASGCRRVQLETGDQQPEAIGLYESSGYVRIEKFGAYVDSSYSICFSKALAHAPEQRHAG